MTAVAEGDANARAALERAAGAGIHRLAIPTPFAVGRVNTYLIEDDPLTLIDSGPNSGKSLYELELALAEHGRKVEDLELLVVTHQHMDHFGLADVLARRSGAEVAALDALAPWLGNFSAEMSADDDFSGVLMRRHGVPEEVTFALHAVSDAFRALGTSVTVTRPLADGSELALRDRTLRVLHRPGHSPSDTLFWDERRRILIAADHLIKRISSNPLLTRPLADGGGAPPPTEELVADRPRALVAYLASLAQTRELPAEIVLSGHGDPITDHVALIDKRLKLHRRRADKIHNLVAERPRSAHEVAQALWGSVALTQAFLTLSEVLGHVDLLLEEGRVRELERDGVVVFEAA